MKLTFESDFDGLLNLQPDDLVELLILGQAGDVFTARIVRQSTGGTGAQGRAVLGTATGRADLGLSVGDTLATEEEVS